MLISYVIHLTEKNNLSPIENYAFGRESQAWFLGEISRHDKQLAGRLHENNELRPYTISGLIGGNIGGFEVEKMYVMKITSLDQELSSCLLDKIFPTIEGAKIILKGNHYIVNKWTSDHIEDEWAGRSSFIDLINLSLTEGDLGSTRMIFQFVTPTAFRSQGMDIPFPLPSLVFRSLLTKWNAFCPSELFIHDEILRNFDEILVTSEYNLTTQKVILGKYSIATGFIGTVKYAINRSTASKIDQEMQAYLFSILRLLTSYTLYCGIGHHTSSGLGQTRATIGDRL